VSIFAANRMDWLPAINRIKSKTPVCLIMALLQV
jgi:hypothetical protein